MSELVDTYTRLNAMEKSRWQSRYEQIIRTLEAGYFGFVCLSILIGSCFGGITVMEVLRSDTGLWQLIVCVGVTVANLIVCILQFPVKWVLLFLLLCIAANGLLWLLNILN